VCVICVYNSRKIEISSSNLVHRLYIATGNMIPFYHFKVKRSKVSRLKKHSTKMHHNWQTNGRTFFKLGGNVLPTKAQSTM